ncbi:ATP-binding protein [Stenotrophomonas hibiscicola]|uniref:ATP-binding protein n=1 Tax=Stenotrophomonas hibiscicola TaxID=86189 RepID=UPI002E798186|nr:ATP-binding protein [[Pseudomonas] hibiscicola]
MRRRVRLRLHTFVTSLMVLILLPAASAEDAHLQAWPAGREVRVATAPSLRPLPAPLADSIPLPTLAHGYAQLAADHSGLRFRDIAYTSTRAAVTAVCRHEADLVLVMGGPAHRPRPCPGLMASGAFDGGKTVLAVRKGEHAPRDVGSVRAQVLAVIRGGPYASWLATHHPQVRLLHLPDRHAALAAVDNGIADAAIGLEATLHAMIRRHFAGKLQLHPFESDFSTDLHLLVRREDQQLLRRIDQALHDITLEEHAGLLALWAQQMLPAPVENALDRVRALHPPWLLYVAAILIGLTMFWQALRWRIGRKEQRLGRAAGMISHEVRNSAQTILASIDLLSQSRLSRREHDLLAAARAAGHALRRLLDRSLAFSRLASGSFRPHVVPCDVGQLCAHALDAIRPEALRRGLSLKLDCTPDPAPTVALDADGLRQIVDNLLGNALKFTDAGGIEVRLQLSPIPSARELLLDVIDSGIGIAPAQLPLLFRPFQQGEDGQKRGGTGLGLTIARELAIAMGGNLAAYSVHGRGSRFTLRLPVRAVPRDPPTIERPQQAPLTGTELLLVEDHALSRRVVAEQLGRLGADVCAVADAETALAEQALRPRGTVVLDIGLHGRDGYGLAQQLRARAKAPLRVIALSARMGRRHVARCRRAGFDAVLVKPLQVADLLQALGLPPSAHAAAPCSARGADPDFAADIAHELAGIEQSLQDADAATLRHHAHRLQGTLQMCRAIDQAGTAAALWELGQQATPDWVEAWRLLQGLQQWHGSRKAEAVPSS